MSLTKMLTPEDRALIAGDGTPDLPPGTPPMLGLMQPNSPALSPGGDDYVESATAGDYLDPYQGAFALIKGAAGVPFVPVAFERAFPEYLPNRAGYAGKTHPEKPVDAQWRKAHESPDGKAGLYRDLNGNRVEETIFGHLLVIPSDGRAAHGATFAFRSTSLAIGRDFANRASRLKSEIDGATLDGPVIGKWLLSSRLERKDSFRWYLPVLSLLGKLGEARGPTLNEVRFAARLRANFKQGLAWMAMDPPEPPVLEAPEGPPEPPPHPGYDDGPDEEDISF